MEHRERMIVALTGCAHALSHGYQLIFPAVLLLLQKEFSIGYLALGIVGNIMNLTYGLGALPGGMIYNRLGPKKLFLLCFSGSSVACFLVAFSPNLILFTVGTALIGALGSIYHPMANALITTTVREYGKALGIHGAVGNLGLGLVPFGAGLIGAYLGWRSAYLVFALPGIVLSAWAFFIDMSPRQEYRHLEPSLSKPFSKSFWGCLTFPLILLYLTNMLNSFCYQGAITFLPTFLAKRTSFEVLSLDKVAIGGMLSAIVLCMGVFGQYGGGALAQKGNLRRNFLLVSLLSFPLILSLSFATDLVLLVIALTYFLLNFSLQPMNNTLVAQSTSAEMRGTAFGISFFTSFGFGSLASSFSGYVAQRFGLQWVFLALSSSAFLLIWAAFFLLRMTKPGSARSGSDVR